MSSIDILVRVVLALTLVLASLALGLLLGQAILWALGTARRLRAREAERRDAMLGVLLAGPTSRQRLGRCLPRRGLLAALLGPLDRLAVRLHLARLRRAGVVRLRRWPGPEGRGEGVGEIRIYALTELGRELAGRRGLE